MTSYNLGYLASGDWSAWTEDDPQVETTGQWSTATRDAGGAAYNYGGFLFNSSVDGKNRHRVAKTGYTDVIRGGEQWLVITEAGYPDYGIWLKPNTTVDLGPVASNTFDSANYLEGYGQDIGIQIGFENRVTPFKVNSHSGGIKGGSPTSRIYGNAYALGGEGIANYGIIDLSKSEFSVVDGQAYEVGGIGILNWGSIQTGSGGEILNGQGFLSGIYNSADLGTPVKAPRIQMRAGDDLVRGWATEGKSGIYNDGVISMGKGSDLCSAILASPDFNFELDTTGYFGGSGQVVMGKGDDVVRGFGNGTFWGGKQGQVDSIAPGNLDSLWLVSGLTYVISEISTNGKNGKNISGFAISSGERTMNVFGFDTFGTNEEDQIALAAGTYTLPLDAG